MIIGGDQSLAFYQRVQAEQEEILSALRTVVRFWAIDQFENLDAPRFNNFLHKYPEWNHQALYPTIELEIEKAVEDNESAKRGRISGLGKAGFVIRSAFDLR